MKKKKSSISIDVMILLAIGAIVFLVIAIIVPKLLGKGGKQSEDLLGKGQDSDGDGIGNFYDRCPCNGPGDELNRGCPQSVTNPDDPAQIDDFACQ